MSKPEKEIQEAMKELAEIEARIKQDIERYNLLASQHDTDQRLAMMSATSYREDYEEDEEEPMTHDEYVASRDFPPNPHIHAFNADMWFPSSICVGY